MTSTALIVGAVGLAVAVLSQAVPTTIVIVAFGLVILGSIVAWTVALVALTERLTGGLEPSRRQGAELLAAAVALASGYAFLNWWFGTGSRLALVAPLVALSAVVGFGRRAERVVGIVAGAVWLATLFVIVIATDGR